MLTALLKKIVVKHREKTAIVYDELRISYEKLYSDVVGLSAGFQSIGIKQGDCIALVLPNCPEFITSFFAASKVHAVALLVNPALAAEEIKYYIKDSGAVAIITDNQKAEACRNIISKLGRKISLIVVDENKTSDIRFIDLINENKDKKDEETSYKDDVVYQYSSGSTGRPKRVVRTQKNLYHEAHNFNVTVNTTSADNILCIVPFFHAHGLGNCILAALYTGATLIILEDLRKDGKPVVVPFVLRRERVLELIVREKISILPGVPFIFNALAETPDDIQIDMSNLRLCFSAGNFLSKEIYDKFMRRFGISIRQLYGCTEVGSFAINLESGNNFHYNSVGLPMKNNEVKIIDDSGKVLPEEVIGEISIISKALTSGYCNMPELNKTAFKDGYFLTGDLGKIDKKSCLYITGRKKIFIECGGNKVDPLEVEDILITHTKVKEAVVVGIKGPFDEEVIKAVIVPEGKCTKQELILYCKNKLASFKIPQVIEFREEIPKSPLGKILRKDLI